MVELAVEAATVPVEAAEAAKQRDRHASLRKSRPDSQTDTRSGRLERLKYGHPCLTLGARFLIIGMYWLNEDG
jgi:hypothetical protein